jgi:hypothetical protein
LADFNWNSITSSKDLAILITTFIYTLVYVVTCMDVTIDGVWISCWIYWTLWYSAWLHFTFHYNTLTSVHSHVVNSHCLVTASNGGSSTSSGFPNCPRASATSFSQQQLTATVLQFSNWVTKSPTDSTPLNDRLFTNCPSYNISARTAKKTPFLSCSLRAVV